MRRAIVFLAAACFASACANVDAKLTCTGDDDCHEFYACDLALTQVCLRACENVDDCLGSQYCDIAAGNNSGVCRDGEALPGDPGAGDPGAGDPTGD